MILKSLCNSCLQPYKLLIETRDVPLIKEIADETGKMAKCPKLCGGMINLVGEPNISALTDSDKLKPTISINGTQLYKAVMGAGLPHEIPHEADIVEAMLLAKRVVGMSLETVKYGDGPPEIYLHELKLEGGVVLHFTMGQRGSRVLKITKEGA